MVNNKTATLAPIILSLVLLIVSGALLSNKSFLHADYWLSDQLVKAHTKQLLPDKQLVVIDIDDYSLTAMSRYAGRWVWPRSVHAELIEALAEHSPKAIVFDILFSEPDIYRPDADLYFNEVVNSKDNVYFAMLELKASKEDQGKSLAKMPGQIGLIKTNTASDEAKAHLLTPAALSLNNWRLGTINFVADSDGIGRRYDVWRDLNGWTLPSLPAKVISGLGLPLPQEQQIYLHWRGASITDFVRYRYADVYQAIQENNQTLLSQFQDRIIIIGSSAAGLFDVRATPVNQQYPAVYMLATAIDNLKNNNFMQLSSNTYAYLNSLLAILFMSVLFARITQFNQQLLCSGIFVSLLITTLIIVSNVKLNQQVIFYVASPIIIIVTSYLSFCLLYGYQEYLLHKKAVNMFGRFVDPTIVDQLLEQGKLDLEHTSKQVTLTVLFSDIRDFTSLSEQFSAEQIVALLNRYFDRQVQTIFNHHGTVDKFIGDCVMAFWGAPVVNENQQIEAIDAALAMEEQLQLFQQTLPAHLRTFDIGIGIHTGVAVVGMIGTNQRVEYTAIGDTVNLASRIEGLTKNVTRILVSEQTKTGCEHAFDFIYHGEFSVKGRTNTVKLYQPKRKNK